MCRLAAITSNEYFSPMENILALETMKEGHDGSGLGLTLKDLGGRFRDAKGYPILSGISSNTGTKALNEFMDKAGFKLLDAWSPKIKAVKGITPRDHYFARVYDYPKSYKTKSMKEKEDLLMNIRLMLRKIGEPDQSLFAFSFYPDILTLKEVGDPLQLAEFFGLDRDEYQGKDCFRAGQTEYQLCDLSLCLPSLFHSGILLHDKRREYGLCTDTGVSDEQGLSRVHRL